MAMPGIFQKSMCSLTKSATSLVRRFWPEVLFVSLLGTRASAWLAHAMLRARPMPRRGLRKKPMVMFRR